MAAANACGCDGAALKARGIVGSRSDGMARWQPRPACACCHQTQSCSTATPELPQQLRIYSASISKIVSDVSGGQGWRTQPSQQGSRVIAQPWPGASTSASAAQDRAPPAHRLQTAMASAACRASPPARCADRCENCVLTCELASVCVSGDRSPPCWLVHIARVAPCAPQGARRADPLRGPTRDGA